jgi:6-phosphogluconolactonase
LKSKSVRTVLLGGKVILERFETAQGLASAAAQQLLEELQNTPGPAYYAALSGGRIASDFFTALAEQAKSDNSLLTKVHFFWADERCVPPNDPESNFRIARELLFKTAGVRDENIHRIKGELDPPTAARLAAEELCNVVPTRKANCPVLDMIFLGMGEDGHVASLFPPVHSTASEAIYFPVVASKPPPNRITISYEIIAAAKAVSILVSGAGKERALRDSLADDVKTPLGAVIRNCPKLRILTDLPLNLQSLK